MKIYDKVKSKVHSITLLFAEKQYFDLMHCTLILIFHACLQTTHGSRYSRMNQVKYFKGCIPQILLAPFLNTLIHIYFNFFFGNFSFVHLICLFLNGFSLIFSLQNNKIINFIAVLYSQYCIVDKENH